MSILVGTSRGLHPIDDGHRALEGPVTALSRRGSKTWLLHGDRALYRSVGGGPWQLIAPIRQWPGTCMMATSLGPFIGTEEGHLLFLRTGIEDVDSFDRVVGRDDWYTPWGGPPATRSISEGLDGTLYVNIHVGGIIRSTDGARSWEPTIDIHDDVHQVLAHPERAETVLAACGAGFARSDDAGRTWRFETEGLHAAYCRAVAVAGDQVLVTASRSHRGEQGALYRRPLDSGGPFERCRNGLPEWFGGNVDTHWLAAREETVAVGSPEGSVFVSTDSGATWSEAASGLGRISCVVIA